MPRFVPSLLALVLLVGCETAAKPRGPRHPQPAQVIATQLLPNASPSFSDTDGNGYFDALEIRVYVFAEAYPESSVSVPGAFTFRLIGKGGKLLREWTFDQAAAAAARRTMPAGPIHVFQLSLLGTPPGDIIHESTAELATQFTPVQGPVLTAPSNSLRVGRVGKL